jgi:F0F1-type ATP synthase membrane subunit b/b'
METISLKVSPAIAKAFEKADDRLKKKAEILANLLFENLLKPNTASNKLETILDKGAAEAAANGFTPDQLEDLLKEGE